MDLTLFIMLIIISLMLYYLTSSIQSLIREMREVKRKCIVTNKVSTVEEFDFSTPDPAAVMKDKAISALNNLKNIFV